MVDGPSLGGFVCPVTILASELWKLGQVRPGDGVAFRQVSIEDALVCDRCTLERGGGRFGFL